MDTCFGQGRMVLRATKAELSVARNRRAAALAVLAAAMLVGGCGVRGNLESLPEAKATGAATSPDAADAGANSAVKPKPHKPFVLDGLLR